MASKCDSVIFSKIFLCGSFLKSSLNLLHHCFCYMLWSFGREAWGIMAPQLGIKPTPMHWKAKAQPLGHQGSLAFVILNVSDL